MKRLLLLAVLLSGCGYVGEPLPPLLNIPSQVTDLQARQIADRIRIEFTIPPLTTEGEVLTSLENIEIKVGPGAGEPFSVDAWAAGATALAGVQAQDRKVVFDTPVTPWIGREVVIGANLLGRSGRASGWSNLASVAIVSPLAKPDSVKASDVQQGVRLAWTGNAPGYRVLRLAPGTTDFSPAAEVTTAEWIDTATAYGKPFIYKVTGLTKTATGEAVSEDSAPVQIIPVDSFPPHPPAALKAVLSTSTVELAWEPSGEPVEYVIYRSETEGAWERLGATAVPAYSDKPPRSGAPYRYAVSARDSAGNESEKSAAVPVAAP